MKKSIIIAILIFIVLVILIVCLAFNVKHSTPSETGEVVTSVATKNWVDDGYVPDIPEDYTSINKANITSKSDCVAEAVAYKKESGDSVTYVKVWAQNRGDKELDRSSVCKIELYNNSGKLLHRIGGVIENTSNIAVGERTIISTQYYGEAKNIEKAIISFEKGE